MSTRVEVVLPAASSADGALVFAAFREVEATMNEWRADSPIGQVNARAGEGSVVVPRDVLALVKRSLEIGALTGGAFDVTWAALWGIWDFRPGAPPVVPKPETIAEKLPLIDYRLVKLDEQASTIELPRRGMKLGLGGIAKGYALDRAVAALRERKVGSFLISGGGQVYAGGRRGDRRWRIGIRDPRGEPDDYVASLEVEDVSLSTSGDYEHFFEAGGVRYHHILDPRTGQPTRKARSATVISPDAALADALSTALMVLGPKEGIELVQRLDNVDAVIIDAAGDIVATPRARALLRLRSPLQR
jgi:FAD:protein FMN transferase